MGVGVLLTPIPAPGSLVGRFSLALASAIRTISGAWRGGGWGVLP